MTTAPELALRAADLVGRLTERGWRVATAESCTGGLVAAFLTEVPGSSAVLDRGFVTYSNAAKSAMLGVDPDMIDTEGAVSEAVARAMAEGALARADATMAVAITGIAGPGGATPTKPVGLVHLALASKNPPVQAVKRLYGGLSRSEIRLRAVADAFGLIETALAGSGRGA